MTPEQQRIKIAEACPFVQSSPTCDYVWTSPFGGLTRFDPLNDLNAMHEAEKSLTDDQKFEYVYELNDSLGLVPLDSPASYREAVLFAFAIATARQRAEAFLKTLNLWTE